MKKLAVLLIIGGISLLAVPPLGKLYTRFWQNKMYEVYQTEQGQREKGMEVLGRTLGQEGIHPSKVQAEQVENLVQVTCTKTPNGLNVLGLLTIPKIEAKMLWVEGVTSKALKYAAGHMPGTSLPGEMGNFSLAAHRSYTFGDYFSRLDELQIGDEILVEYEGELFIYEVYDSFLVEPDRIEVLESQGNESVITLITCHPAVNPTHRLIVRGKLKS